MIYAQFVLWPVLAIHAASITSSNWAGYEAQGHRGMYRAVNMFFTVPHLSPRAGTSVEIWDGLGGNPNHTSPFELVQAGIGSFWDSTRGQVNVVWWYTIDAFVDSDAGTPKGGEQVMNLQVKAGDQIQVFVSSNDNNDGKDLFVIKDLTTHQTATQSFADPHKLSDSATVECIVESPGSGGGFIPLAKFGIITLTSCAASTNNQSKRAPIGNFPNDKIDMANGSTTLATTSPLKNKTNFSVIWHHS
ncbi:MAG TPA: G1 family glutamic endopeptidase [Ktedonobacteraceae bacterium]|nr:G1 family glutamic endopeptidase [Ktedonobacteraceae bacterium]